MACLQCKAGADVGHNCPRGYAMWQVVHVEGEHTERRPLSDIALPRQPSSALPAGARPPQQASAKPPQHCQRPEASHEGQTRPLGCKLPRPGHAGRPEHSAGLATGPATCAQEHPDVPEQVLCHCEAHCLQTQLLSGGRVGRSTCDVGITNGT